MRSKRICRGCQKDWTIKRYCADCLVDMGVIPTVNIRVGERTPAARLEAPIGAEEKDAVHRKNDKVK